MEDRLRNEFLMREAFDRQVKEILGNKDRYIQAGNLIGFEGEVGIYKNEASESELRRIRNRIVKNSGAHLELGATQIEITTAPLPINDIASLREAYEHAYAAVRDAAFREGVNIYRGGSNPFLPTINPLRTKKAKYQLVPDYQNRWRRKSINTMFGTRGEQVDIGDASIISLFQAFQPNLEARSIEHAVELLNRSFMISPFLLAISGNARYLHTPSRKGSPDLYSIDTGYNDLRITAWEISHDTRSLEEYQRGRSLRIGLPENYFRSIEEYFARMRVYPFILFDTDAALQVATGLTWLDARIKLIGNSAVVELRSLPTQPTIEEEIALALCYVGRLAYGEMTREKLMPINLVDINRNEAITEGLAGQYWHIGAKGVLKRGDGSSVVWAELGKARKGLRMLNLPDSDMDILFNRFHIGSPSARLACTLGYKRKVPRVEMLCALESNGMLVRNG